MTEKPFATAKGKIWTLTPNYISLEDIYTKLSLVQKERKTDQVKRVPLADITHLFDRKTISKTTSGCTRILVTGNFQDFEVSLIEMYLPKTSLLFVRIDVLFRGKLTVWPVTSFSCSFLCGSALFDQEQEELESQLP